MINVDEQIEALYEWVQDYQEENLRYLFNGMCKKIPNTLYRGTVLPLSEIVVGNRLNFYSTIISWTYDFRQAVDFMNSTAFDCGDEHAGVVLKIEGLAKGVDVYEFLKENEETVEEIYGDNDIVGLASCECEVVTTELVLDRMSIKSIDKQDDIFVITIGL